MIQDILDNNIKDFDDFMGFVQKYGVQTGMSSEENIKIAKETGNKLTQGLTEDGELVGVNEMNTQERVLNEGEQVTSGDIPGVKGFAIMRFG